MNPETKFRIGKVVPFLKHLPNTYIMAIQQLSKVGDPDLIVCIKSKFVAMELKYDQKEKLKKLQKLKLDLIRKAGGVALEVNPQNWEEVKITLRGMAYD